MHRPARFILPLVWLRSPARPLVRIQSLARLLASTMLLTAASLLTGGAGSSLAQSVPPSGTLRIPDQPPRDQPLKSPLAAPREPVHKTAGTGPDKTLDKANVAKTPVVAPHGPVHPHKPPAHRRPCQESRHRRPRRPRCRATAAPAPPDAATNAEKPEKTPDSDNPEGTPAKLPRFASLRSDDVNMRAGPGTRYRIDWVYKRRDLPVEIEREFDVWRWVRDADGIEGWVHQATLMGRRDFIVQKDDATLRSEPSDAAAAVATLKPGVIGRIRSCEAASDWCNVQAGPYRGYLHREQFWGVFPNEAISP